MYELFYKGGGQKIRKGPGGQLRFRVNVSGGRKGPAICALHQEGVKSEIKGHSGAVHAPINEVQSGGYEKAERAGGESRGVRGRGPGRE